MKSKRLMGVRNNASKVCGEEPRVDQLTGELMLGDVIWVKINGCTWWPGQVVDENNVSDCLKPQNRVAGEVLVRLYGSYEYLYVDSMKWRAEFENILKQNNGSYSEVFQKALEQDLSSIKSAQKLKRRSSEPKGKPRLEACIGEKLKQHGTRRTQEADRPSVVRASPRRQQNIKTSQKRVKSGELAITKAGEEASENDTPKQNLVQKKLNKARSSPRREQDNSRTWKRVKSGDLVSRKAEKEASKIDTPRLAQKKLKENSPNSARSSPRRQAAKAKSSPRKHANRRNPEKVKSEELVSRKLGVEASKNDASKKKHVQKKAREESARGSPRRQQDNSRTRKRVRSGELISRKAGEEALENDTPKQVVQKKLKSNNPDSARCSPRRQQDSSRPQKRVKSRKLISKKAGEGASKIDTPKQDPVQKKLRPNSPNSVFSASGISPDLSERRTRVMQNLGLIAPCGSPFQRNGLALPNDDVLATQ
ncbi:hypothetical protein NE237_017033 [Protea cynaroides]|uniref:PWWP domain-containing protein n=1 Tax=Protea cynaroides TaxID=273540 RepID=A0A9Q0K796_9MAGN|nr:hypothetical protein NE237_017033 [Protea cynaroides]